MSTPGQKRNRTQDGANCNSGAEAAITRLPDKRRHMPHAAAPPPSLTKATEAEPLTPTAAAIVAGTRLPANTAHRLQLLTVILDTPPAQHRKRLLAAWSDGQNMSVTELGAEALLAVQSGAMCEWDSVSITHIQQANAKTEGNNVVLRVEHIRRLDGIIGNPMCALSKSQDPTLCIDAWLRERRSTLARYEALNAKTSYGRLRAIIAFGLPIRTPFFLQIIGGSRMARDRYRKTHREVLVSDGLTTDWARFVSTASEPTHMPEYGPLAVIAVRAHQVNMDDKAKKRVLLIGYADVLCNPETVETFPPVPPPTIPPVSPQTIPPVSPQTIPQHQPRTTTPTPLQPKQPSQQPRSNISLFAEVAASEQNTANTPTSSESSSQDP